MPDTLNAFQDTIHHTVMDTVKYIGVVMNNATAGLSWKDNLAIIISICAAIIAALGFILNYRLRKKDFQSTLFNKQFEAYDNLLTLLHKNYESLKLHFEEYDVGNIGYGQFQQILEDDRRDFFEPLRSTYLFHNEVIEDLKAYLIEVNKLISATVPKEAVKHHIQIILFKKLMNVENKIRSTLAIEKLSQDTFTFITSKNKIKKK